MITKPRHSNIAVMRRTRVQIAQLLACLWLLFALTPVSHAQSDDVTFGTAHILWSDSISAPIMHQIEIVSASAFSGTASESAFSAAMHRVLVALESDGYRRARISPGEFTLNDRLLDFALHITPGPRSRVVDYGFAGIVHADTLWLRTLINQPVNVPLTADWLRSALARLQRLSSVRVTSEPEIIAVGESPDATETLVVVRWPLEEDRNARLDGVLAAGGEGPQSGLTGRAAMQFDGLFGRDRSVAVRYNRPRPEWNSLNLRFSERGAFGGPLDWGFELDASNQFDRRQRAAARVGWSLGQSAIWSLGAAVAWQRVTPIRTVAAPSRNIDASLGIERIPHRSARAHATEMNGNLWTTLSHRQTYSGDVNDVATDRLRLDAQASVTHVLGDRWDLNLESTARAWLSGSSALSFGDEWYLGGPDHLRGYDDQAFAAASGVWGAAEIGYWLVPSLGIALFGEAAHFNEVEPARNNSASQLPIDYGAALRLISAGRIGRLEFAWRRDAALRDGYVRLKVSQSW